MFFKRKIYVPMLSVCIGIVLFVYAIQASVCFVHELNNHDITLVSNYVNGNVHVNPSPLNSTVCTLLEQAQKSILLITFTLSDQCVINLLNKKADQGLDVVVIVDKGHQDNVNRTKHLHPRLQIKTRMYGEGHIHHKVLVIDHEKVWFSTANFSISPEINLAALFLNTAIAQAFEQEAKSIAGEKSRTDQSSIKTVVGKQAVELYILPENQPEQPKPIETKMNEIGKNRLLELIDTAKSSIKVMITLLTYKDISRALVRAKERGVRVELITRAESACDEPINIIKAGGIPVKALRQPIIHLKLMIIDDTTLLHGTANWSMNMFSRSDESFIVIHDLTQPQRMILDGIWKSLWCI